MLVSCGEVRETQNGHRYEFLVVMEVDREQWQSLTANQRAERKREHLASVRWRSETQAQETARASQRPLIAEEPDPFA